jgi:hypothetical protein
MLELTPNGLEQAERGNQRFDSSIGRDSVYMPAHGIGLAVWLSAPVWLMLGWALHFVASAN